MGHSFTVLTFIWALSPLGEGGSHGLCWGKTDSEEGREQQQHQVPRVQSLPAITPQAPASFLPVGSACMVGKGTASY